MTNPTPTVILGLRSTRGVWTVLGTEVADLETEMQAFATQVGITAAMATDEAWHARLSEEIDRMLGDAAELEERAEILHTAALWLAVHDEAHGDAVRAAVKAAVASGASIGIHIELEADGGRHVALDSNVAEMAHAEREFFAAAPMISAVRTLH